MVATPSASEVASVTREPPGRASASSAVSASAGGLTERSSLAEDRASIGGKRVNDAPDYNVNDETLCSGYRMVRYYSRSRLSFSMTTALAVRRAKAAKRQKANATDLENMAQKGRKVIRRRRGNWSRWTRLGALDVDEWGCISSGVYIYARREGAGTGGLALGAPRDWLQIRESKSSSALAASLAATLPHKPHQGSTHVSGVISRSALRDPPAAPRDAQLFLQTRATKLRDKPNICGRATRARNIA